ncbi:MAG: ABC transporter permease subunit [Candidatus Methylomirabilota bacterium]
MSNPTQAIRPGKPLSEARPDSSRWARAGVRRLVDRLATRTVTVGGLIIIGAILAILLVIVAEVIPLFRPPTAARLESVTAKALPAPSAVGVDEYREIAYLLTADGIAFRRTRDGSPVPGPSLEGLAGATVTAHSPFGRGAVGLGTSDGRLLPVTVKFQVAFQDGTRTITPDLAETAPLVLDPAGRPIRLLAYAETAAGPKAAALLDSGELVLLATQETRPLIGDPVRQEVRSRLPLPPGTRPTALALDIRGEDLYIGTAGGELLRADLRDPAAPALSDPIRVASAPGAPVTLLGFILGDRTLIVGDQAGGVAAWRWLQEERREPRLARIYRFRKHPGPVAAFDASRRDKSFVTADDSGSLQVHYATSGATLLSLTGESGVVRGVAYAPKADGLLVADAGGRLSHWPVQNPHPETTLRTLFGTVWYEGYNAPEHVWQSTGGTDDFEAKLSLTPLIYGTLKGTFYALIFAVPIALLSALYASQFMHPTLKGIVKPTVEIMAALPSVVLGFLAGLWLAPQVERVVPGIFLALLVVPAGILLAVGAWRFAPPAFRKSVKAGSEVGLLLPLVAGSLLVSFWLGGLVEQWLLQGDYRAFLLSALGLTYDQRNSLVVGIAMGFAVIPIIFTIAEDSLSNVPQHLVAGSLALGATRWQTALRVVLPTASPGIFSAVMIGFGRAVGETMIVLMATGNTPIMDGSIFNGFRALSANIAVELPEAPEGGTLFRTLFLAALLLFAMTFVVNTAAELIRLRLRKRYRTL